MLVLADTPAAGDAAAWRAAVVARELALPLRLLHVRGTDAPPGGGEHAVRELAAEIGTHLGLPVAAEIAQGDPFALAVQAARNAAMLVLGSRRGNPLRELVLGTQAERLIRLARVPVLVVKRIPSGAYRRVLVPVELGPAALPVIAAAARLSRDPQMEVLHALHAGDEIGMRACELPEWAVRRMRERARDRARGSLRALIREAAPRPQETVAVVGFGDPAVLALQRERVLRADLVVIGKRRRGWLADFLLGSVTQRVLAQAQADVLVLPAAGRGATGPLPLVPSGWTRTQLS